MKLPSTIEALRKANLIREVDAALAELVLRRHPAAKPTAVETIALGAALASRAVLSGHSGIRIETLPELLLELAQSGDPQAEQMASTLPALPTASEWHSALTDSPWVGSVEDRRPLCLHGGLLQLHRYAWAERRLAESLIARASSRTGIDPAAGDNALNAAFDAADPRDAEPMRAARVALDSRLLILCGGPGTGKTHTVLRLLAALTAADPGVRRIHLAAPTGKAASRLNDSLQQRFPTMDAYGRIAERLTGPATTLHRLLGLRPDGRQSRHHRGQPLPTDLLVVDEVSMVDLPLMARLLDALPDSARLVLIGDPDQLSSVEAGDVLAALDRAGDGALNGHRITLRHSHRFASDSSIGTLAETVRVGDANAATALLQASGDLQLDTAADSWMHTLQTRTARLQRQLRDAGDPETALALIDDYRILCALRRGPLGADAINAKLDSQGLHASGRMGSPHYPGRLLLIRENQPRLGLHNGDTGVLLAGPSGQLKVWFRGEDGAPRGLSPALLPAHHPAWALTVHQSQGSEFDAVDIVLGPQDSRVLGRQLLYTAITRSRRELRLLAAPEALQPAIRRRLGRISGLLQRLEKTNT